MNGQQENGRGHKVKIGSKIKLYYDGKLGRMTIGEIIGKKQLHKIKVRFIPWVSDEGAEPIDGWLKRKKFRGYPTYYTGYVMSDGDKVIGEILVSQDQDLIYKFLGYDERKTDFENLDGMFEFVATSEYFDPDIYLLHNRNHVSRVRDAKRPTYNAFLQWCEEHPEKTKFRFPTDEDLKDYFKYSALCKAFSMFPNFLEKYDETEMTAHKNKELGKVFNGNIVSSLTGLTGKDLGGFMKFCKSDFRHAERVMYDVNEWVNLKFAEWSKV